MGHSRRRLIALAGMAGAAVVADGLSQTSPAAAAAANFPRDPGMIWATDYGTIGQGGDDWAVLNQWLQGWTRPGESKSPAVRTLFLPAGDYRISKSLIQYQSNVILDPNATISPLPQFEAGTPLWMTSAGLNPLKFASLEGGIFECQGIAAGVLLSYFNHFTFSDALIRNYMGYGVQVGLETYPTGGQVGVSYELFMNDVSLRRDLRSSWDPRTIGLWAHWASDNEINEILIQGAGIGVQTDVKASATNYSNIHVWGYAAGDGYPNQFPESCFLDNASGTSYVECTADTPAARGFDLQSDAARLTNCRVFSNARAAQGSADAIYIAQPGARSSFVNCAIVAARGSEFANDIAVPAGSPDPLASGANTFVGNTCYSTPAPSGSEPSGALNRRLNVRMATDSVRFGYLAVTGSTTNTADFVPAGSNTKTVSISGTTGGVTLGTATGLGASMYSGTGSPAGKLTGKAGDLYVDKSGAPGAWIYRCSGATTWVAMI